jgi:hypothetical protein
VIFIVGSPAAASLRTQGKENAFDLLERKLLRRAEFSRQASERADAYNRLNQLRNYSAIKELFAGLPGGQRPARILYAASGDHMAPLVACITDPSTKPYAFIYTEVNPSAREGIDGFLKLLVHEGLALNLSSRPPVHENPGGAAWSFNLGRHPVSLTLVINPAIAQPGDNRLYPAWALAQSDMVITHDWAGDQQENLRLVWEFLQSVRKSGTAGSPLMMLEDLERHPYPVDLSLFCPLSRTLRPYGHCEPLRLPAGLPKNVEMGTPLYGGGIVLGFADTWWRGIDDTSLICAFNFLLFNQFDDERTNVIEGGTDPVLAPALLDWSTGFGYRAIDGQDVRLNRNIKPAMIERLSALAGTFSPPLAKRWGCRMLLYKAVLELKARGGTPDELFPPARYPRRLGDPSRPFPSTGVETMAREAQSKEANYLAANEQERQVAGALLRLTEGSSYVGPAGACLTGSTAWPNDLNSWRAAYTSTLSALSLPTQAEGAP